MKKYDGRLFCFSPPVMIATFIIEVCLAVYTIVRHKFSTKTRLVVAILVLLAIFQLAEFSVCGGTGLYASIWSRVGYVSITLLPTSGLHLAMTIAKRPIRWLLRLAYGSAVIFAAVFSLSNFAFIGHICAGNYAVFQFTPYVTGLYFVYYYLWLLVTIIFCLKYGMRAKRQVQQALILQVFGTLSFVLPTGIVNMLNPSTISGIPSIMCGFAIIYALILTFGIVPLVLDKR